jgi:NADPH-dependent ferric siderophore reductase
VDMAEVPAAPPSSDDPFRSMPGTTLMQLTVVDSARVTPSMQRLRLTAPELAGLEYRPGQDMMLLVAADDGGRPLRRRYTIRDLDREQRLLTLDIVRHADGPGERWIRSAGPGATIEGIGPRGKVFPNPDADWHLFIGDESALAAIFSMARSLPAEAAATVILEVPEPADEQDLATAAKTELTWLPRGGAPAGEPGALTGAAATVEIRGERPHAYLIGEARVVLALRETLERRGFTADQISPKAYWGRGKANAGHGEPARDR